MPTIDLQKLQESRDIQIHELNPEGKYFIVIDQQVVDPKALVQSLQGKVHEFSAIMVVNGKPYESISMYEIL